MLGNKTIKAKRELGKRQMITLKIALIMPIYPNTWQQTELCPQLSPIIKFLERKLQILVYYREFPICMLIQIRLANWKMLKSADNRTMKCLLVSRWQTLIEWNSLPTDLKVLTGLSPPLSRISPHLIESNVAQGQSQQRIPLLEQGKLISEW